MNIVLYYSPISCSMVPFLALAEAEAEFEVRYPAAAAMSAGVQTHADLLAKTTPNVRAQGAVKSMITNIDRSIIDEASKADTSPVNPTRILNERAAANVRAWREYLPEDCVAAMIKAGWPWST